MGTEAQPGKVRKFWRWMGSDVTELFPVIVKVVYVFLPPQQQMLMLLQMK